MLRLIQVPIKCWKNLPSSISVRARAHLLLRAQTCSSSVASPIAKIPKGDLEAMPRVTQKQRNWTPKSARCTHCVPLAREIKNWRDLDFRSNFPFFCVCILSDFRPISTPETRLYWPSVTIKTVKKNKTYCNFDILLFIFSVEDFPYFNHSGRP